MSAERHILTIACPDEPGLIARISGLWFRHGANVVENGEFVDADNQRFFMRTVFDGVKDAELLGRVLETELPEESEICMTSDQASKRILLMGTKEPHCLGDLLVRCAYHDLRAEITSVISNHQVLEPLVKGFGVPYHFVSHEGHTRESHEEAIVEMIEEQNPDLIVMAKYMRILTPAFTERYRNKIINIHHSFLPAFIGANPYRQAYERGVKVIGATAHFASEDLDEGPIIAQDVVAVNHTYSPRDMARSGHDVEKRVLARAVRYAVEDRVVVTGNKTIVFE